MNKYICLHTYYIESYYEVTEPIPFESDLSIEEMNVLLERHLTKYAEQKAVYDTVRKEHSEKIHAVRAQFNHYESTATLKKARVAYNTHANSVRKCDRDEEWQVKHDELKLKFDKIKDLVENAKAREEQAVKDLNLPELPKCDSTIVIGDLTISVDNSYAYGSTCKFIELLSWFNEDRNKGIHIGTLI